MYFPAFTELIRVGNLTGDFKLHHSINVIYPAFQMRIIPLGHELITEHLLKRAKSRFVDNYNLSIFLSCMLSMF